MPQGVRCANARRGREPATATDSRKGKPLKAAEPHGRYRVKAPERSAEEQVAEVVENGVSGTTAGVGKPVPVDSTDSMRRRGQNPRRGAPRWRPMAAGVGAGLETGHRGGDQPHERRQTAVEYLAAVVERANTPRVGAERRKAAGGEAEGRTRPLVRAMKL
jgi:hypothetical protein